MHSTSCHMVSYLKCCSCCILNTLSYWSYTVVGVSSKFSWQRLLRWSQVSWPPHHQSSSWGDNKGSGWTDKKQQVSLFLLLELNQVSIHDTQRRSEATEAGTRTGRVSEETTMRQRTNSSDQQKRKKKKKKKVYGTQNNILLWKHSLYPSSLFYHHSI